MSYCRFENTTSDMEDCVEQLRERTLDDLNEYELRSLGSFLDLAREIVDNEYYIKEILDKGEQ
tara:strand:+ start:1034 stop:1222 length:189 start_codon:yes stop_codon:yes gene_type:complete